MSISSPSDGGGVEQYVAKMSPIRKKVLPLASVNLFCGQAKKVSLSSPRNTHCKIDQTKINQKNFPATINFQIKRYREMSFPAEQLAALIRKGIS